MDYESEGWGFESLQAYQVCIRKTLRTVEVVSENMPVACFLDSKERTEAIAEGARGYVSERSETKDRIPPGVPSLEFKKWGWKNNYSKISSIKIKS